MIEIPLSQDPNQELQIILDKQNCTIQVFQRAGHVYLSLKVGNTTIQNGALCIPKTGIIAQPQADFKGQFRIIDSQSQPFNQSDPEYKEFGTRFKLFYLSEEEESENAKY